MRDNIKKFIEAVATSFPVPEPIYEFGALQVAGQVGFADLRPFFAGKHYVGCDFRVGPGVDEVRDIENMGLELGSAGTMLIVETLEHVRRPFAAIDEAWRALRPDGLCVITSAMNFPIHAHPYDYWRFTPSGFASLLEKFPARIVGTQGVPLNPHAVLGVGFKDASSPHVQAVLDRLRSVDLGAQDQKRRGLKRRLKRRMRSAMAFLRDLRAIDSVNWELDTAWSGPRLGT